LGENIEMHILRKSCYIIIYLSSRLPIFCAPFQAVPAPSKKKANRGPCQQPEEGAQVIDVDALTLQNVITFPPDGAFLVNSGISIASDQRVDFKFDAAALKVNGNKIPFPPFGQGWCACSCCNT
jgi:hypothetical protein